jgi:hypothetical protein
MKRFLSDYDGSESAAVVIVEETNATIIEKG